MKVLLPVLMLWTGAAVAASQDEAFLDAREAFQRGDAPRLEARLAELAGHPLEPYARYWQLRMHIDSVSADEIQAFLAQNEGSLIGDRLRADWLRQLARQQAWDGFVHEYARLSATDDAELACDAIQARIALGETEALSAARMFWHSSQAQPDSCLPLFGALFERQLFGSEDVWLRARLALEAGNRSLAKTVIQYLPPVQRPDPRLIDSIARKPQKYLERVPLPLKSRAQQELAVYALYKAAESWPLLAAQRLREIEDNLPEPLRSYAWGQVAMVAAWNHNPNALDWFSRADESTLSDVQLAWKARAALRAFDWNALVSTIDAMTPRGRMEPQWRYWKARALAAQGRQPEANLLLAPLSNEFNFYGQLAAEDLGAAISSVPQTYRASEEEIKAIAEDPGIRRALTLYRVGLRYEGALEWQWTVRDFDDRRLLAAAELDLRNEWYERAIHTAERTAILHDFSLRYPAPYREAMQGITAQLDLDEAWVYGLIRQESRFVSTARSGAGAAGLMQLMPSTAKWVAKRLGFKQHHSSLVDGVDTNLNLGTYYLRQMLSSLDNRIVVASAAYNAGPRRAQQWLASRPLEGAIYAETIPYPETRDYVKKVMSNTMYYARLFRQTTLSLRDRLGVVPARPRQDD